MGKLKRWLTGESDPPAELPLPPLSDLPLAPIAYPPAALRSIAPIEQHSAQQPVERATFKQRAQAIAEQYRDQLSTDYIGKHQALAKADVLETLFRAVSAGLNQRDSCAAAGISPDTYQRWMARADAEPDGAHAALAADLKAARSAGKLAHLENIKKHSAKEWTASAWTLERTDPEQFGKREADSSAPRVVVQIGVRDGDVSVALSPQPALPRGEGEQNR